MNETTESPGVEKKSPFGKRVSEVEAALAVLDAKVSKLQDLEKWAHGLDAGIKELSDKLSNANSNGHVSRVDYDNALTRLAGIENALTRIPNPDFEPRATLPLILVALAYHPGDVGQATELLKWIDELSGPAVEGFHILLVADAAVPREQVGELHQLAKKSFLSARSIVANVTRKGWPAGPDGAFLWAARYIKENYKLPFLWLEPDCVPLKDSWLYDLAAAYERSQFRFMGAVIDGQGQQGMPAKMLAGCAVYPNNAFDIFNGLPAVVNGTQAWDVAGGVNVVEGAENTPLIQHFWGPKQDAAPVFIMDSETPAAENQVKLNFLRPGAVLFHRCKDSSLIKVLRVNGSDRAVLAAPQTSLPPPAPAERLD